MKSKGIPAVVIVVVSLAISVLAVLGGRAISAQDTAQAKYTVRVPNGLAFSEFRGYEGWQTVSISRNEKLMAVILANPDRKSTRLNSSHLVISYAVFCLKKKKTDASQRSS